MRKHIVRTLGTGMKLVMPDGPALEVLSCPGFCGQESSSTPNRTYVYTASVAAKKCDSHFDDDDDDDNDDDDDDKEHSAQNLFKS